MNIKLRTGCLLLCLTLSVYAGNCQAKQLKKEISMNQNEQRNKETVRKIYEECLNRHKMESLKNYFTENYTGPRGGKGYMGLVEAVQPLIDAFPDIKWDIEDLVAEGDKVVVRWEWKGTFKGSFYDAQGTGKQVINHAIAIYRFEGDKVAQAWMETDRLGFLQQIGLASPELGRPPVQK